MPRLFSHKSVLIFLAAALLGLTVFCAAGTQAQEGVRYTETEKIGFAFHKLAGFDPDFESWIYNSETYKNAAPAEKVNYLRNEVYRLQNGYYNYMPDQDLISLELPGKIYSLKGFKAAKDAVPTNIKISFDDIQDNYLAFPVGDLWVAIVIKDLEKMTNLALNAEDYAGFATALSPQNVYIKNYDVRIVVKLRPLSVDTNAPIEMGGLEMWLMLAEIGSMDVEIEARDGMRHLWDYNAPWYVSDRQQEWLLLYQAK